MKKLDNPTITNFLLVLAAFYALFAGVTVVFWPALFRGPLREVLIWGLFVSPAVTALGGWRIWKRDCTFLILVSTVVGTVGVLLWCYAVWKRVAIQ